MDRRLLSPDAIVVLGCRPGGWERGRAALSRRAHRTARAFHDHRCTAVIASGGRRWHGTPEADLLADILVVAAGVPNLIVPQIVRTGAVVIDVGFNRLPDGRIVGDVDFEGVKEKASYITPVPGGVGQLTVTMLLHNTILSAERVATQTTSPFQRRSAG